jgi:hypothetical protein
MRLRTFGFNKMLGNYQVATQLVASRVVLSSIELVSTYEKGVSSLVCRNPLKGFFLNDVCLNWYRHKLITSYLRKASH